MDNVDDTIQTIEKMLEHDAIKSLTSLTMHNHSI